MVTALNEAADFERGVQVGTDDFLTKPVNKVELLCRIRSLLRVRHLKTQLDRTLAYLADFEATSRESSQLPDGPPGSLTFNSGSLVVGDIEVPDQCQARCPLAGQSSLKPRRARPFFARHPWVFDSSIERVIGEPSAPGDQVDVVTSDGQRIATRALQPHEHDPRAALSLGRGSARRRILAPHAGRSQCGSGVRCSSSTRTGRHTVSFSAKGTASRASRSIATTAGWWRSSRASRCTRAET